MIAAVTQAYLLADSSKFDVVTPFPVTNTDRVAGLVADRGPTGGLARWFAKRRIDILVP
jgi:DeoR/GlpR family transcriptional regulator of sugar metabolism